MQARGGVRLMPLTLLLLLMNNQCESSIKGQLEQEMGERNGLGLHHITNNITTLLMGGIFSAVNKHDKEFLTNAALCAACKTTILSLQLAQSAGKSGDFLLKLVKDFLCKYVVNDENCSGLDRLTNPQFRYILNKTELSPDVICGFIDPQHCPPVLPPELKWEVPLPPEPASPPKSSVLYPQNGKKVLKVLHLTDTHVDKRYVEGSWDECGSPLCCREPGPANATSFAGKFGGWKCDIPHRTLHTMLQFVVNNITEIDHVIWTGDIHSHGLMNQTVDENLEQINETVSQLRGYFPGPAVVLPSIGNHETRRNLLPTPKENKGEWSTQWLYDALSDHWTADWISRNQSASIKYAAFYKLHYRPGLLLVSINSMFCFTRNWWLILDSVDPGGELAWLVSTLAEAEQAGDKVHIIAHVPPNNIRCLSQWRLNYYRIINRFRDTVTGQFFGHTHHDEFSLVPLLSSNGSESASVLFTGPSVTTYTYLNPGFRIYYIDGDYNGTSRKVLDYDSWIMDLEESNRYGVAIWKKMYSAKEAYGLKSMEPAEWRAVYDNLRFDDQLLDKYHKFFWNDSPKRPKCDETCRDHYLCTIVPCN